MSLNYDYLINKLGLTSRKKCLKDGLEKPCNTNIFKSVQNEDNEDNEENDKKKKRPQDYSFLKNDKKKKRPQDYSFLENDKKKKRTQISTNVNKKKKKSKKYHLERSLLEGKKTKKYKVLSDKNKKKKKSRYFDWIKQQQTGFVSKNLGSQTGVSSTLNDIVKLSKIPTEDDKLADLIRKSESNETIKDQILKKSLDYKWGIGIEHEMQLFHNSKDYDIRGKDEPIKYGNILFDSQESTCHLTNDLDPQGACCKKNDSCVKASKKVSKSLNKIDKDWLSKMDWELSGRQARDCSKGPWILERVPVLMPEIITGDHKNRNLQSICNEIIELRKIFINLQKKNPFTQQKIKKYGDLITHPCGTEDNILIPVKPTIDKVEYKFEPKPMKDYLGSYHITITLPYHKEMTNKDFILRHQRFGQALQWIEPLLITSYFTGDPSSVGSKNEKIKGSFRIMAVGWGNLGGSDVRKFGSEGVSRGADIKLHWREKTKLDNSKIMDYCAKKSKPTYPHAKSIYAGDFRTFSFDFTNNCKGHDCPKVDGGKMVKPNGMEIRIFDHFDDKYIQSLLHIVILLAENAQRHPPKDYVYKDKRWINALDGIMRKGWNSEPDNNYIKALRENLGLKIDTNKKYAYDIFKQVVKELFEINKFGMIPFLMIDPKNLNNPPEIPSTNRICWAISMDQKVGTDIKKFLSQYKKNTTISIKTFEKDFYKKFKKNIWEKDFDDVINSIHSLKLGKLEYNNYGRPISIRIK